MKNKIFLLLALSTLSLCRFSLAQEDFSWQKLSLGITESNINCLAIHPQDPHIIFAGTSKAVYKSDNRGRGVKVVLQVQGSDKNVNYLYWAANYIAPNEPPLIYAATNSGLFVSQDEGKHWERIFYSANANERKCRWVAVDENWVYLATEGGLFYRDIMGSVWNKAQGIPGRSPVFFLAQDEEYMYAATQDEIFRMDKEDQGIKKIFSMASHETSEIFSNGDSSSEPLESTQQIRFLRVGGAEHLPLYIVTDEALFYSADQGESWQRQAFQNVPFQDATSLVVLKSGDIFLGTSRGLFHRTQDQWLQVYKGMETNHVNFLTGDQEENIYAATDKGIFLLVNEEVVSYSGFAAHFQNQPTFEDEPSIQEVHRMTIDYAEVDLNKIKSWRRGASVRAWLPTLSAGIDRGDSDFFHWDTGANPDELRKGRDLIDWDISISWDLADLIWNPDQTSIDSRSKLMVELREDILDQVTRLYFERRRLQMEFLTLQNLSSPEQWDKEMRITELTALLDAYTAGGFSRRIQQNSDQSPVSGR